MRKNYSNFTTTPATQFSILFLVFELIEFIGSGGGGIEPPTLGL